MQIVPDIDGTEILLEKHGQPTATRSTSYGVEPRLATASFCRSSCPGGWMRAYRAKVSEDFTMTSDESRLAALHGLDAEQNAWRRNKISQLGSIEYFSGEFPLTPDEAFLASQFDCFITSDLVMAARKTTDIEPYGPLLIGVDPAGQGDDATAIAWRRGTASPRSRSGTG